MKKVFLIAPEPKKEQWKTFFDLKTGNKIKWVEDTKNIESGYCLIAMKTFIEKREVTFREIEEKFAEQLQNARKVFIFHLMTGISHVDYLEKIQGKENWYYSVIDLDKKVIGDFNHKLLQELETAHEDDIVTIDMGSVEDESLNTEMEVSDLPLSIHGNTTTTKRKKNVLMEEILHLKKEKKKEEIKLIKDKQILTKMQIELIKLQALQIDPSKKFDF